MIPNLFIPLFCAVFLAVTAIPFSDVKVSGATLRIKPGSNDSEEQVNLNLRAEAENFENETVKLWPKGRVVYKIDKSLQKVAAEIHIACKAVSDATCIDMVNLTTPNSTEPYLWFNRTMNGMEGCVSLEIGFTEGKNTPATIVATPDNCQERAGVNYAGIVVHEIFHALGFLHEFSRPDRDAYLNLTKALIQPPPFPGNTQNLTFDFESITMYDGTGFKFQEVMKREGKWKNYPAPHGHLENMGQECKLSIGDRNLVDKTYAEECNLPKPVKLHTKDFPIPGTDCSTKYHPSNMMDEMAEEMEVMSMNMR